VTSGGWQDHVRQRRPGSPARSEPGAARTARARLLLAPAAGAARRVRGGAAWGKLMAPAAGRTAGRGGSEI
jgi:hypothetical protein